MYKTFHKAKERLADIQAVDFFFAKEVLALINSQNIRLENSSKDTLFHLLMELMSAYSFGHSCIKIKDLADKILFASQDDEQELREGYKIPSYKELIDILDSITYTKLPIYFAKDFDSLYIKRLWCYEEEIAEFIRQKTSKNIACSDNAKLNEIVSGLFETTEEIDYQKQAVLNSFNYDFSIISGGPGTGKTTTVAKLLLAMQMFNDSQQKVALLAPTGKAAQRMTESLKRSLEQQNTNILQIKDESIAYLKNLEAQTIHRFLGLRPNSKYIKYHKESKAPYDVIIVDEASMLDINIFIKLIRAVSENTKLILLGDINQLPSVEVGSLLASLTVDITGNIPSYTTKLLKNYRSQQNINNLANSVLMGEVLQAEHESENIKFYDSKDIEKFFRNYADKYKALEKCSSYKEALEVLSKFRILVANKNLDIGTDKLNQKIEKLLGKTIGSNYKARPIMITQNSYSLGLFNGDIGIIWPDSSGRLRAYFDGKDDRVFSLNMLPNYETVYVMTIHKTQGSEFDEVAIILPDNDNEALTKQLIYTAITRAKSKLDIVSQLKIFNKVIKKSVTRNSNIQHLIE
ncbi:MULTISPECIES: exodeoxyribonuclease V subunit alpha [unclassified Francisella]|uniref:exodeoxyribonuclease V subunit alpha n=1 Tax=unclassified Francisella TaxID=2610885 RepID=UPI002E36DFC0|nr:MULTISPECIES: exodeoxyribonuclease V subunit alpha [unclassified Francisella]MED7818351.1 exodeoxyribonuclease V subunit alpha [Francisella sp. 19S2-4]MED7829187.1 exodeoxyribonuclease V subunit alpha [Francisella sp. 19S2-10]